MASGGLVAEIKSEAPAGAEFVQTDVKNEDSAAAIVEKDNDDGSRTGVVICAGIGVAQKPVGNTSPQASAKSPKSSL